MDLSQTSCYVYLGKNQMGAILRDSETGKYYYQIVNFTCLGIEKKDIVVSDCVGPFDDFQTCNDKLKEK